MYFLFPCVSIVFKSCMLEVWNLGPLGYVFVLYVCVCVLCVLVLFVGVSLSNVLCVLDFDCHRITNND